MRSLPEEIRVLHVEDDPEIADLTATFLERENTRIEVEPARDAEEGLARLGEADVDCIVSDYEMPGRDGIEFLREVRDAHSDLPFVLFTGRGSEEVASEAISAGVSDYLQKESGTEQYELLANRIENAVAQHRAQRRATEQERILLLLRDINKALVNSTTRDDIAAAVVAILADADPYSLVWFGEYDDEYDRLVPTTLDGVNADAVTPTALPDSGGGIVTEALETGAPAVAREPDPALVVWDETAPIEYESAVVAPIVYHGDRYGLLALYADREDAIDAGERKMLQEIAGDVAQALHTAETRRTLEQHSAAVEAVPEGVFVLDEDATIELVNERAAALLDRTPDAIENEQFPMFVEEGVFDEEIIGWYLDSVRRMLSSSTDREEAWFETEIHPTRSDSRRVEIHLTLRPYEEEYRGTVGVIRDVAEREQE